MKFQTNKMNERRVKANQKGIMPKFTNEIGSNEAAPFQKNLPIQIAKQN
jgi:hypothetical protein